MGKIKQSYEFLLDKNKPLLPQLRKVKRACFAPYKSDLSLIKWECEACSAGRKYSSCLFYEATHLDCFAEKLKEIQTNEMIKPPKKFHPDSERLCFGRTPLEKILKGTWTVGQHRQSEPTWVGSREHQEWNREHKEIQKDLPCESTCKMRRWCSFYNNGVNVQLCHTDITGYDEDGITYEPYSEKYDKGIRVGSYLYKHFVKHSVVKELSPIKNDGSKKKLDEWQYKIYEKVYKKTHIKPKIKLSVIKYVLDVLATQEEAGGLLLTYLIGRAVTFNREKMSEYDNLRIWFDKHLGTLKQMELVGTLEQTTELQKVREMAQKNQTLLSETSWKVVEVNLTYLLEYIKQRKLELFDPFYEYYLSMEKNPSRAEIEERFKISRPTQVVIERRLGIRKDFRNKGAAQLSNLYLVNPYAVGAIFRYLSLAETEKKLEKVRKINKENVLRKNSKKINTNKQLGKFAELYKQLTSN
jgi:hypothetical protein